MTAAVTIRIALDAEYDLSIAGYDRDEATDFTAAYVGAADYIGEKAGVVISVVEVGDGYEGPQTNDVDASSPDYGLWQAIHDCTFRDETGEWQWDQDAADATARDLRMKLA